MKNKITLRNLEIIGAVFGVIFGTMLHFLYAWSGKMAWVGIFAAVNESVWEHTKLLFFPIALFMIIEWFWVKDKNLLFFAKLGEYLVTTLFIISFFYTYTGALGIQEVLIVDIASFVVAVIMGKAISYAILTSGYKPKMPTWIHTFALFLIFVFYGFVTFYPPQVPLFQDPEEKQIDSFEECSKAGNPVMESYPAQCRANGITFTETIGQ